MNTASPQIPLIALFHHKWAMPTLAVLHELGGGAKFVTLCSKLGVARESMQRTLAALIELDLVRRNPGYGHPMRPEYVLTAKGTRVAPACAKLWKTVQHLDVQPVALKKWALPTLGALGASGERFGQVAEALGAVTPRALAQALKDLQGAGIIERQLKDGTPPYAEYRLTRQGRKLAAQMATLGDAAAA